MFERFMKEAGGGCITEAWLWQPLGKSRNGRKESWLVHRTRTVRRG